MLKSMLSRKVFVTTAVLFALFLIYIIPKDIDYSLKDKIPQSLEYVDQEVLTGIVYLLDSHNMLARSNVVVNYDNSKIEYKAKELLQVLIKGGSGEDKIQNGFMSLIPSDTKILGLKYDDGLIKVNFSDELLDVSQEMEEKIIEAIVYTLTNIENVNNVIIYVEGDILDMLPKSKVVLPSTLNRNFGINKEYDIESFKNINQVIIYYINKFNDNYYYVPVTKYINDDRDKIKIVIDELSSSHIYSSNLMSFLNSNTKLLASEQADDLLQLEFNSYIFDNELEKKILEEVIYTICLSVADNYNVKEVSLQVNKEEIYKTVLKTIE